MRADAKRKRDNLLEVATELILEKGYDGASMGELIKRAGGSKASIYKYFGSKENLLAEVIDASVDKHHEQLKMIDIEDIPVREALIKASTVALEVITSKVAIDLFKVVYQSSNKYPSFGRTYHERGPAWGEKLLAQFLENKDAKGEINCEDPFDAAELFWSMLLYKPMMLSYCNLYDEYHARDINAHIEKTVDRFLRIVDIS